MSISRKEDGSLVRKAGLGIVDNILNRFSHNAVSNSAVTEAITEINNDLSDFKFRNNNGVAEYSMDNGVTWGKVGGSTMKCAKFGTVTASSSNQEIPVDISSLGLTNQNQYMVIVTPMSAVGSSQSNGVITSKTATGFKIKSYNSGIEYSYQVITFI